MRNGNLVKAGIGLKTFKGPFDQVAMYPAHMHKVNFSTQQVTKEMQSVEVSGMLVWTVNRVGNGPLNAYKNLGSDLSTGNPREANNSLEKMASAVVRSCIANSTITEMLSKRQLLRDAIKDEMFEVVKGWGVWLETIEITGVKICNGKLFKDLQTTFREKVHKDAELHRMQINNEIQKFTAEFDKKRDQIERDVNQEIDKISLEFNQKIALENENFLKEKLEVDDTIAKMEQDLQAHNRKEMEAHDINVKAEKLKQEISA